MSSSGYIGLLYILDILVTTTDTKASTYVSCFEALSELKQGGNYFWDFIECLVLFSISSCVKIRYI